MEIIDLERKIIALIEENYSENDYPCLYDQYRRFKTVKPLAGMKILSATPVFLNIYAKILPLVAGGAEITFTSPSFIKSSKDVISKLKDLGFRFWDEVPAEEVFDYVLDCGGEHAHNLAKGYIEFTKSGEQKYSSSSKKYINVDDSKSKIIEDSLGTSDGLIRALRELNIENFHSLKVLIVGFGKVGEGAFKKLMQLGADVKVYDPYVNLTKSKVNFINNTNELIAFRPELVISATGVKSAIEINGFVDSFKMMKPILVNLGVEDEFGEKFLPSEVLYSKMPLNFILTEPTKLKYLDPSFALQNECILFLENFTSQEKIQVPYEMDEHMCKIFNRSV
jgi:adenosylhomocysteinase